MEKLKQNEEKQKAEENERFRLKDQIDEKVIIIPYLLLKLLLKKKPIFKYISIIKL